MTFQKDHVYLASHGWARTASRPKGVLVRKQRCLRNERGWHLGANPTGKKLSHSGFLALVVTELKEQEFRRVTE